MLLFMQHPSAAFSMSATKGHCFQGFLELSRILKEKWEWFDNGIIYAPSLIVGEQKGLSSNKQIREWAKDLRINAMLALGQSEVSEKYVPQSSGMPGNMKQLSTL